MALTRLRAALAARRQAARTALAVLGSRSACSWPVLAIYAPLGLAIQVPGNVGAFGGSPARWALASAIGMVALGGVLAALRLACRRNEPRPIAVLAAYAVGAITQSVTFGLASIAVSAADDPHLSFRLGGLLVHLPLLAAIGYAVGRHDTHRLVIADLERARGRLLAIGQSLDAEVARLEAELGGAVRASLDPALAALDRVLAEATRGSERAQAIRAIDGLIEERVRPLSHELAAGAVRPDDLIDETAGRTRVPVPARFRLADGISPGLATIALAIVALPTALRDLDPAQLLLYETAFVGGTWTALALLRRAVRGVDVRTPIGVVVVVAANVAIGSAVFQAIGAAGVERPAGLVVAVAMVFALFGTVSASTLLVEARRETSEAELAAVTERLEQALTVLRRRQRLVTRRLAFLVHGSLQGALHAAALRIAKAETVDEALTADIRRDVDAALAQIDASPRRASGRTATMIAEVTEVWTGLRRVTTQIDPAVEAALLADADADEAVSEVLREAVNNAIRHGRADQVEIAIASAADPSTIAVTVRDDGTSGGGVIRPGLGSALFDDLCRSWTATGDASGTTFSAVIPFSRSALDRTSVTCTEATMMGAAGFEPA